MNADMRSRHYPSATLTDEYDGEAVVVDKILAADGVVALHLGAPGGGELPSWSPGSHLDLGIPGLPTRQYSLCGDPHDRATYRVGVLRSPSSRGTSRHIHDNLRVGDTVNLRGPRNHFPLREAARYIFVAGGIGVTPLLPMIAHLEAAGAQWTLAYAGRRRQSMAFLDELSRYGPKIAYFPKDETGPVDLASVLGEPDEDTLIYCCGPERLLSDVEAHSARWRPEALRLERFSPRIQSQESGTDTEFKVKLARSDLEVAVPADRTILDAVRAAGVPVESSCREGICGTCEVTVLDGLPDHRDSVLDQDERDANDCMMICVSRSRHQRLVLDL